MISEQTEFLYVLEKSREFVAQPLALTEQLMSDVATSAPEILRSRLEQILSRKGKRIRAILLLLIANSKDEVAKDNLYKQASMAAGIELLHLASLVHDDVIDKSSMRRGGKTPNQRWGNKIAVLLGDYLLAKSMELSFDSGISQITHILSKASASLVAGEVMEIDLAGKLELSHEEYFILIEGKTSSLFEACASSGAIIAGYDAETIKLCEELGRHFGVTFQIVDDLLDYGVGADDLGKAKFADLANGLTTLPIIEYFSHANTSEKDWMRKKLQKASTGEEEAIHLVSDALNDSGAFSRATDLALARVERTKEIIHSLPSSRARELLNEINLSIVDRPN